MIEPSSIEKHEENEEFLTVSIDPCTCINGVAHMLSVQENRRFSREMPEQPELERHNSDPWPCRKIVPRFAPRTERKQGNIPVHSSKVNCKYALVSLETITTSQSYTLIKPTALPFAGQSCSLGAEINLKSFPKPARQTQSQRTSPYHISK